MYKTSMILKKMETLPEELLLDTFHYLDLYEMVRVRGLNRCCHGVSKEYALSSPYRIRGSLRHWRTSFPKLTSINIQYRTILPPEELLWVSDVESIHMAFCGERLPVGIFSTFSNLKVLDIQYCSQSWLNHIDEMLVHLTNLTEFRISENGHLTDAGIRQLVNLEKLHIHNCANITDTGLAPLTKLVQLDMYNMYYLTDDLFKSFVHLTDLKMTFGRISTTGICHLKKLNRLYVMGCSRVSHCQGFQHLPLQNVHITNCAIPDENMCYLSHVPIVSFYGVTYLGGTHFSQLTNTHTLSIFKLSIEKEMVEDIIKMRHLKKMYMYDCYMPPEIKQQLKHVLPSILHTD